MLGKRKAYRNSQAPAFRAGRKHDLSPETVRQRFHNGQSKAAALRAVRHRNPIKTLEDARQMGLRNSRTGILDFNSRGGDVNDRANQDHPPGAVVADGIVDQVCQQFANQDAIARDDRGPVKSIELDVDIARESLWRTLR